MSQPKITYDEFFEEAQKLEAAGVDVKTLLLKGLREVENIDRTTDIATLNARLKAVGMMSIEEFMDTNLPPSKYSTHVSVKDQETFCWWVESQLREYVTLEAKILLDKGEEDELYEWAVSHRASFSQVWDHMKAAGMVPTSELTTREPL